MKLTIVSALAGGVLLYTSGVAAAESTDLAVKGEITANYNCVPSLADASGVNYGPISLQALKASDNQLSERKIVLKISCTWPTLVGWRTQDNRSDSNADADIIGGTSAPDSKFGLGKVSSGENIGSYQLLQEDVSSIRMDGKPGGMVIVSTDGGQSWTLPQVHADTTGKQVTSMAKSGGLVPVAFKSLLLPYTVRAAIQNTVQQDITDDTQLDGQMTFSLVYL